MPRGRWSTAAAGPTRPENETTPARPWPGVSWPSCTWSEAPTSRPCRSWSRLIGSAKRLHVRMDYTDARVITLLIADAQARMAGQAGISGRRATERRMRALVGRFPRWEPRSLVALAMQQLADGQPDRARALFAASTRGALDRGQAVDAWWALHLRSRALHDEEAAAAAASLANAHNLHKGAQEPSPGTGGS